MISDVQITEALAFYGIDDNEYALKMKKTASEISGSAELSDAFDRTIGELYTLGTEKQAHLWDIHTMKDLFGREDMPAFSTNLFLLSGYATQKEWFAKRAVDPEETKVLLSRVRELLLMRWEKKEPITVTNVLWGSEFINMRLVEVGRLQYEFENTDGSKKENVVFVHIPANGKLDAAAVKTSLTASRPYIKKIFGAYPDRYECQSWLLSNQIATLYALGSNLKAFYELFDVKDGVSCVEDMKGYLYPDYKPGTPVEALPEKTSLQRKVKQFLLDGNEAFYGIGVLK